MEHCWGFSCEDILKKNELQHIEKTAPLTELSSIKRPHIFFVLRKLTVKAFFDRVFSIIKIGLRLQILELPLTRETFLTFLDITSLCIIETLNGEFDFREVTLK
ncbi:hypothetical protein Ctha_2259 [Chloroherpeton thalassium ATCC 35110]|uniref:Uncharacterized protein n=1 Tax=Chloroherpeton thalassium (strain ATCC 35110 / GB-78) TaxID=517418 RepID=B3QW56_CHLT3|nr:hypothetical protein [Chloroherpeton thalassium]ACF14710.1 hypothetical protein Ctha_2259 [Chloroherpeton thalassium ATCC 35110]